MTTQAQDIRGTESLALRPREAAQALGVSPKTLWRWTKDGTVPYFKVGVAVLYPVDGLKEWIASQVQAQRISKQ